MSEWEKTERVFRGKGEFGWEVLDLSDWSFADLKEAIVLLTISRRLEEDE